MSVTSSPINCSRCSVLLYSLQSPALDDDEDHEASLALSGKKRHQYNSSNKLLLQNTKGFAFPNPVNDERERVKRGGEA